MLISLSQSQFNLDGNDVGVESNHIGVLVWISILLLILELKVKELSQIGLHNPHLNLSKSLAYANPFTSLE